MKVTIDYVPGPDPDSVTFTGVEKITTVEAWGYVRLVLHRSVTDGNPTDYSTPTYLIKGIRIEEEVKNKWDC